MINALLSWWLVLQALGLLALPLTTWLLSQLPERGYSFARPVGLLLTGYGAWLLSMLNLAPFSGWLLMLAALGWGGLGLRLQGRAGLRALGRWARGHWRWIVFQETLLALGIATGLWLRWHQFWGTGAAINITEQPMDLTLLTGILTSPQFPPHDPWLAGYAINYYYLGYLLIAVLTRLTGLPASVGYTLGLATIFALTAGGVAGLVRNLVDATACRAAADDRPPATPAPDGPRAASALRWIAPLLGVVFVLIIGNQGAALQLLTGSVKAVALPPSQLWQAVVNGLGARQALDLGPAFPAQHFDGDRRLVPGAVTQDFAFGWWPSRMVWDRLIRADGSREITYAITEFPFFSFLLGDLHPHVLALPWTLLAIATALNLVLCSSAPSLGGRHGWLRLGLTGIVLGGLYAINSWDLPTYLLLYLGALTLLYARLAGGLQRVFWAHWLQNAAATVVASYLAYLPFHLSFVAPTPGFPLGLAPARTDVHEFVAIFGLFAVLLVALALHSSAAPRPWLAGGWLMIAVAGCLLLGALIGWPLFGLLPLAIWLIALALARRDQPALAFALWLGALGALVVWGVDLVYLRDSYGSRLNTIFKFYYQVWLLWGCLAAYAVALLLRHPRWSAALWIAPTLLLLTGGLVYPLVAPADDPPPPTLDGLAYLQQSAPDEAAAIDWLRANTAPDARVLQAPGIAYRADTARYATATGRPTLIGWTQHERLWRGGQPEVSAQVDRREQDTITIYTTADAHLARELLQRYDVRYVVVGPQEQRLIAEHQASPAALAKFATFMTPVFRQGSVTIFALPTP